MRDPQQYQCEQCGGIFDKGWEDADANHEAQDLWGVENAQAHQDFAVVCDDCFQAFMHWHEEKQRDN